MKKIIFAILTVCLVLLCFGALTSCNKSDTIAPANLRVDMDTLTLKWSKVPKARAYEIQILGEEKTRTTLVNNYALEYLKPGDYEIKVRAINVNPELEPSEWSVIDFTRDVESGLRYQLINNKTEYELTGAGTASGDIVIDDTYRGKPVTSIASRAFYNNKKITSIVIGKNVKTIGDMAFQKCELLASVTMPAGLTSIGNYAFQSCKALTSLTLPEELLAIAPYTFSYCDNLKTVTMGSKVASIGEYAFSNCSLLETVSFSDGLETLDQYSFSGCAALKAVAFKNVKSIAQFTFLDCPEIASVDFGTKLDTIGEGAFGNCVKITKISIPDSVSKIDRLAFGACSALADVTLGSGIRTIGEDAFGGTDLYNKATGILYIGNWVVNSRNLDITSISSASETALKEGTVGIADCAFEGHAKLEIVELPGVKYIGAGAFQECKKLWQVVCDDSLLAIDDGAFYECALLHSVHVGNSLVTIGNYAFQNCALLLNMNLPDSLRMIGSYAFRGTNAYKNSRSVVYIDDWAVDYYDQITYFDVIYLKESTVGIANYCFYKISQMGGGFKLYGNVKYIGNAAFYGCDYAQYIDISEADAIEIIGDYAFYNCMGAWFDNYGIVPFPETLQYIGRSAFYNCGNLIGITVPKSCKTIGDYAFYGCTNLGDSGQIYASIEDMKEGKNPLRGDIILRNGIESIGSRAFQGCTGIVEIQIPGSVTYLGERAFYKCTKLETAILSDGLLEIPAYTFYKCTALKTVIFSDSIKTIGESAFKGCTSIDKLMIGSEVETIGRYAFYGCTGVNEINLPESVKNIGDYAFKGCGEVTSVLLYDNIEVIGKHAFYGLTNASFFCVSESIKPYWHARWNSSYRPVFWGCEIADDIVQNEDGSTTTVGDYVVSFTKQTEVTLQNGDALDASFSPTRAELYFQGWATTPGATVAEIAPKDVINVTDGTVLYSVWGTEPLPEPEPEEPEIPEDEEGSTEGGTEGGAEGGTEGGAEGGTEGGTEGGSQGSTEGGSQGSTEGETGGASSN